MANHTTVIHGTLTDLKLYLERTGWELLEPKGKYEVLRARKKGRPGFLLVHFRTSGGCGYSIDERDMQVYYAWEKDRKQRGLEPRYPSTDEERAERESVIKYLR